jgi:hypothetical protein
MILWRQKGFWSVVLLAVTALSVASCEWDGGRGPAPEPEPEPAVKTTTTQTVSGRANSLSPLAASGAKLGKAAGTSDAAIIPDASISITSYDKSDKQIDKIVISTGTTGSFTASIEMNNAGGYLVIEAKKDGFADYSKRIDFDSPTDVELSAELKTVVTAVATAVNGVFTASGKSIEAFTFGVVRYPNGTKKAVSGSKLTAAKAAGARSELEIVIPAAELAAEGVNTLVGKLQTFDSSNPDDAANFPGDYVDSNGDRLVSLAFDYINITDENGKNLGEIVAAAKAAGRMKKAQNDPTIITRWVPAGACKNLLRDVVCAETDPTTGLCKKVADDTTNSDGVFQVPVYTYNPKKGDWVLLGLGKLDTNNDGSTDAADLIGDFNGDNKADQKDYQKYCTDNGGIYLRIEVTNEDFLAQYWNLDYPLIFEEPKKVCIEKTFKDSENSNLSGLYVRVDGGTVGYMGGTTDANGKVKLETVRFSNNTTTLSYYNPFTYRYETETVTLGDSPACTSQTNTITKPKRCDIEGKVVDSSGNPKTSQYVWIYGSYPSYFYTWAYTDSEGKFTAEVACEQNLDVYTGYDWTVRASLNVNGNAADSPDYENTDDGDKVVLNDIVLGNMAPYAYGYLNSYSIRAAGSTTAWVYGYDYDGNYPLSYKVSVSGVFEKTGTISSTEWWKEVQLSGLSEGSYPLALTVTDSLGKSSSEYPLGTLTVTGGNRPPVISYAYPTTYSVTGVGPVNLYGWAYDLDSDALTYSWTVDGGTAGLTNPSSTVATYTVSDATCDGSGNKRTFSVNLTVSDGPALDTRGFDILFKPTYSLNPTSSIYAAAGGSGSMDVSTSTDCLWTASSNVGWITITSGGSGSGNGTVSYTVDPNTAAGSRTGTITAAGMVFTVTQAGATCAYSLSPTSGDFTSTGGSGSVNIASAAGCTWTARSNASWIIITSGASGSGNGVVGYYVAANNASAPRSGTITIAGQDFTVNQSGATCAYSITPASKSFTATGGNGSISVTSPTGCSWAATTADAWITITSGGSGAGSGTVTYSVSANPATASRTGTITVGGQTFTVYQAGAPCTYNVSATSSTSYTYSGGSGTISVTTGEGSCTWGATSSVPWITITSPSTGTGSGTVSYTVSDNTSSSLQREGYITIAGTSIKITQGGAPCTYSISPTSHTFTSTGGTGSIEVTSITGCPWTATTADAWITITSGMSGAGSGTVGYSVAAYTGEGTRTGTITVAGQTFTVQQTGTGCTYVISPVSASFDAAAAAGSVTVDATSGCGWSATSNVSWMTITSGSSGTGDGTVIYSVEANAGDGQRTGTLTIGGQTFTVTQGAGSGTNIIIQ